MKSRRVLKAAADGPRFRMVRLWKVQGAMKGELIGAADTPSEAVQLAHNGPGHVIAVDRRGDIYADNNQPTQERR